MGVALFGRGVEEVLDASELAVAADERGFEACRLERAACARHDPQRLPERYQTVLALQLERPRVREHDRPLRRASRRLADVDRPGLRSRLYARGGVDEVARDHPLAARAERDCRLAGQDAGPCPEAWCAHLVAERGHGRDEVERGPNGALGVVLGRDRRAPHGHHRVADELLDRPAVQLDQATTRVEVARQKLTRLLGVAALRRGREPDEIGEEHGDEPPLGLRCRGCRGQRRCCLRLQGRAALAAELRRRSVRCRAARAGERQRCPAFAAELAPRFVLGAAGAARHDPHVRTIAHRAGEYLRVDLPDHPPSAIRGAR